MEDTPLLLDSLSPPSSSSSALSRNRRGGGGYANRRFQKRSQVHNKSTIQQPSAYSSSSRKISSSSRQFNTASASSTSTLGTTSHQTITSNQIWQTFVSLPAHLLCFANPICAPICGLCCCFTCIRTSEYGVMQRFGKFQKIMQPGLHILKWPMEREAGRISMRVRQLDVDCETKSKDHVFLRVHVSIQYQVNSTHLYESFYSLSNPTQQLTTHILDIIRSTLPQLDLDDIFSSQDSIALELHRSLNGSMSQYGYVIEHSLITKISPNEHVKASMNEIEASRRFKLAMPEKAEAVRIQTVKDAEARAERLHLNGIGVARERREIAKGMKDVATSVQSCHDEVICSKGVMDLLLLTQYMDVITDLGGARRRKSEGEDNEDEEPSTSLFVNYMPETVSQLSAQARKCFGTARVDTIKVENLLDL